MDSLGKGKLLITGATGFLGSSLLNKILCESNLEIILLIRETSNLRRLSFLEDDVKFKHRVSFFVTGLNSIDSLFSKFAIETVIHCATNYGRGNCNPISQIQTNILLPLEILESGRKYGLKAFINTDTNLDKWINNYSLSKKHFKEWLSTFSSYFVIVNLSLEHFYGAGDDPTKFVSNMISSFLDNVPVIELTEGVQKRDFVYIDDVVAAYTLILKHLSAWSTGFYEFEIGSGHNIPIRDLVMLIQRLSGNYKTDLKFGARPMREKEMMSSIADITQIQKLGWTAQTDLKEGLLRTIELERRKKPDL